MVGDRAMNEWTSTTPILRVRAVSEALEPRHASLRDTHMYTERSRNSYVSAGRRRSRCPVD